MSLIAQVDGSGPEPVSDTPSSSEKGLLVEPTAIRLERRRRRVRRLKRQCLQ
jgi:hypothetical protein